MSNITTAANVKIAADAPTKLEDGGKKGMLSGKLRMPPTKKIVNSFFFEFVTLSRVLPKT